jgi:hypothetical protein
MKISLSRDDSFHIITSLTGNAAMPSDAAVPVAVHHVPVITSDPDFTMHSGDLVVSMPQLNMRKAMSSCIQCVPECWSISAMRNQVYFMAGA